MPKGDHLEDYGTRYVFFSDWLAEQIEFHKPDWVAYEAQIPQFDHKKSNHHTAVLIWGLIAMCEAETRRAGLPCWSYSVTDVKMHLTGDGSAPKQLVFDCCKRLGWEPKNFDESDAGALWALAHCDEDPKFSYAATPLFGRPAA